MYRPSRTPILVVSLNRITLGRLSPDEHAKLHEHPEPGATLRPLPKPERARFADGHRQPFCVWRKKSVMPGYETPTDAFRFIK